MTRIALLLLNLALAACAVAETGPPGQQSPGGRYNPVNGETNSNGH